MFFHSYCFLNQRAKIQDEASGRVDWEYAKKGGLWLDNLHYMRYLDGFSAKLTIQDEADLLIWLRDWVNHVARTPDTKALNPPYNASERAFSLGRFILTHEPLVNHELDRLIKQVIASDLNFVAYHLEFHLGGNHLLKNLMALAWGACLFVGSDAKKWQLVLNKGLKSELKRQILADGFHYERSPMYHNIALLDLLDVINVARDGVMRDSLLQLARVMTSATKTVTHADGEIAFFNDCALDSCPSSVELVNYSEVLCGEVEKPWMLPTAGLYALEAGEAMNVVAKFGLLGPDEQMGHVHSDLFSFEVTVNGLMLFVNSGTSTYYDQPFRDNERACEAHNTVSIPGYVQCQHWSYFRVASRTRSVDVSHEISAEDGVTLYGVAELLGAGPRPKLVRKLQALQSGFIVITDTVVGSHLGACSHFHLQPSVRIVSVDDVRRRVILEQSDGQKISLRYSSGRLAIEACLVSRHFNMRQPSKKLVISAWDTIAGAHSLEVKVEALPKNASEGFAASK